MKVYHVKDEKFDQAFLYHEKLNFPGDYELVAEVVENSDENDEWNLGYAFQHTNTIDKPWVQNEEVITSRPGCRSTSVGDVIELRGNCYWVEGMGFKKIAEKNSN